MRSLKLLLALKLAVLASGADLILHNGKVLTVDDRFSVAQALAVTGGRIVAVGSSASILSAHKAANTRVVDLGGRTVMPGLIDAHVHALGAGVSEFSQSLPRLDSIADVQAYIREQAKTTPKGAWIVVPRTLPPRLAEMRMPTRKDLDVAPDHPVAFDGSYVWSANTKALQVSGITRDTPNPTGGEVVKDANGEPNGILRNASRLLKGAEAAAERVEANQLAALEKMLRLYAESGLVSVIDRAVTAESAPFFEKLHAEGRLPIRVALTWRINAAPPIEKLEQEIRAFPWKPGSGDEWLKWTTFKVTLDGGQSVGTAYQRVPYGAFGRQLYGQTNPDARGTLFVEPDELYRIFKAARQQGWQLTAHAQGGGAIDVLLETFGRLNQDKPIKGERHHVMHGSYMTEEALDRMASLDVALDAQPGWLRFDVPALSKVFGKENMRWFFPLDTAIEKGIKVAGGSDHMIGHGSDDAVNPFGPFLNMWMCVTREMKNGETFYPDERISREEALRLYTINAAWMQFSEKQRGSIEAGKLADLTIIDRDYMNCPVDEIKQIKPVATIVGGKVVAGRLP